MKFRDWKTYLEARLRRLSSPVTYGKAPPKRKPARRPTGSLDGFIKEIDLLKKDLDALDRKKKGDAAKELAPALVGDEELTRLAQVALANLKVSPKYYSIRRDDAGEEPGNRRVSREEAARIARQLGVDFKASKFTPEGFRKALESEIARTHKPSTFDRHRPRLGDDTESADGPDTITAPGDRPPG